MKAETKKLLLRLEPFAETHLAQIENFISKLENEKNKQLPEVFKNKLATIGNTPLEEPKIAALQEIITEKLTKGKIDKTDAVLDIIESVYTVDDLQEFSDINIKDFVLLGEEILNKVFGFKYEDENKESFFKEIPSHKDLQPLTFADKRKIRDMMKERNKHIRDLQKIFEAKEDSEESMEERLEESEKKAKEYEDLVEAQDNKIFAMSKLDVSNMSRWEKNLLVQKLIANANGTYMPPVGKE